MLYVMTLSGKEIKDFLEMSYYMWTNRMKSPEDHLLWFKEKRRESAEDRSSFQNYSFNFDSASGIIYTVDVTKPLGIIILLFFFLPILTVGGVYSVNSTEMMSGLLSLTLVLPLILHLLGLKG